MGSGMLLDAQHQLYLTVSLGKCLTPRVLYSTFLKKLMLKFEISLILSSYLASIMSRWLFCITNSRHGRGVFINLCDGKCSLLFSRRLGEARDTFSLSIITLDFLTHSYPNITRVDGLPYACFSLLPCPPSYGGVLILSSNSIIHVDQTSRTTSSPVNGWAHRVSSVPSVQDSSCLALEGSRMLFIDEKTVLLFLSTGVVHPLTVVLDGRTFSRLQLDQAVAQCTPASSLTLVSHDHLFVGSTVGPSPLLQITPQADAFKPEREPAQGDDMDEDLDEGIS